MIAVQLRSDARRMSSPWVYARKRNIYHYDLRAVPNVVVVKSPGVEMVGCEIVIDKELKSYPP